jgi:peptidoglycan hydrolase CwlO-like protein
MRRRIAWLTIFFFLMAVYIPTSGAVDIKDALRQRLQDNQNQESRILQDILRLDARLQKTTAESQELAKRLETVQEELRAARAAQDRAEADLAAGSRDFGRSLRFFYTYGSSPFITAAFFSNNLPDFFIRWELLKHLTGHFFGIVRHNLALARLAREKSNLVAAKEKELVQARQASLAAQKILAALKEEQQKKLNALRQQNTTWARDLLALEKAWSGALPSLLYLLQQVPALPWQSLRPDSIQVDLGRGEVIAAFSQQNLNETLLSSQVQLRDIRLVLPGKVIKIPGPDFEVQGTLEVYGPHQLLFIPQNVAFAGLPLDPSTWTELLPRDKLILNLPPPDYGLKFKNISLEPGKMVLILER